MDREELKKRTMLSGLRVMKLVAALPRGIEGRTVGGQLMRAGSGVGSNYRAACRARSQAEFIAKIGTVIEEADESAYWLEFIILGQLMKRSRVEPLLKEAEELTAIMAASRITASRRARSQRGRRLGSQM
jgi:four helix bundle protein